MNHSDIVQSIASSDTVHYARRSARRIARVDSFDCHFFHPRTSRHPLARSAYELWRDQWQATLRELDGITRLHSDEFVRQDAIAVLSTEHRCVALSALRWLDLSQPIAREDSYFRAWPEEVVRGLGDALVAISSNTIVHPDWRGALLEPSVCPPSEPQPLSTVIVALAIRRFLESSGECVIGVTRNDRSMNRVAASVGAVKLGQIELHGIESDLICIRRQAATPRSPVVDALWAKRYEEQSHRAS